MLGVALHGVHQVRDEVVPALELHVNVGPGFGRLVLEANEAVVASPHPEQANDDDGEDDPEYCHRVQR